WLNGFDANARRQIVEMLQSLHAGAHLYADISQVLFVPEHARGDEHQQLSTAAVIGGAAEEVSHHGNILQEGQSGATTGGVITDQAAQHHGLPAAHGDAAADVA